MPDDGIGDKVEPGRSFFAEAARNDAGGERRSSDTAADRVRADEVETGTRISVGDRKALSQAVGQDLLELIFAVGPALRAVKVVAPARQERQVAAKAARQLDVILNLAAVVYAVVGERADADVQGGADSRRSSRENAAGSDQRTVDGIIERELTLPVLLRFAAVHQQLRIELPLAEEVGVVGAGQKPGVVTGRRNDVLLKHRWRESVARFKLVAESISRR